MIDTSPLIAIINAVSTLLDFSLLTKQTNHREPPIKAIMDKNMAIIEKVSHFS